ncbi:MAG: hypothetical protein ABL957_04720 [Parvularculaceae bacterium]
MRWYPDLSETHYEDRFGVSFNVTLAIRGLNGLTANVETNWIMEPGRLPRLVTAVPATSGDLSAGPIDPPPVVASSLSGDDRWAAIFERASSAATAAARAFIPTPMKFVGFDIEMEGACGHAWLRIPDARRGFVRWVVKNGHAGKHYKGGAQIFADVASQSLDRKKAYAMAFAAVLLHNGIKCEVETRLD